MISRDDREQARALLNLLNRRARHIRNEKKLATETRWKSLWDSAERDKGCELLSFAINLERISCALREIGDSDVDDICEEIEGCAAYVISMSFALLPDGDKESKIELIRQQTLHFLAQF